MKHKKGLFVGIAVIAVIALAFAGYNIYRYPAMFRNLSDNSLNNSQVEEVKKEILSQSDLKVLVAYFSYSGTTRNIANAISEKTGGDLFEITPQDGYSNVYMESNSEIRKNERPALTDTVQNMDEYDIVFVGYPVWWHATPACVNTFLESYDLTGKLIIPFCTSGESDIDETMPTFLQSCDGLAVYGERRISGTSGLDEWLSELGLTGDHAPMLTEIFLNNLTIEAESGQTMKMPKYEYETKELYARRDENPDTYYLMWMTVGRVYAEKLLDYDIYEAISAYDKDVLLIHGDAGIFGEPQKTERRCIMTCRTLMANLSLVFL